MKNIISRSVLVDFKSIDKNLKNSLEKKLKKLEGKCIKEGYIKRGTIQIMTYSYGLIKSGSVEFEIIFECQLCKPVEGMIIECIIKNTTKAGIRAEIDGKFSPLVIFIARDHHHINKQFAKLKKDQKINVKIIGQRYELNDKYISVIAELLDKKT